jgi:selenocysteine lyase/cysteine desulfurase
VVVSAGEFPANVFPWVALESRGFTVEILPTGPDALPDEARLPSALERSDVRALAVSHVQFATGHRADLKTLGGRCRERGILFAVDAIQGLGADPVDVREARIDVLACGGQKWLCSPWGSGFTFIDRRLIERFDPPMVSWLAMEGAGDFSSLAGYSWSLQADARRFELATLGLQDQLGLAVSIELILDLGPDRIHEHLMACTRRCWIGRTRVATSRWSRRAIRRGAPGSCRSGRHRRNGPPRRWREVGWCAACGRGRSGSPRTSTTRPPRCGPRSRSWSGPASRRSVPGC